MLFNKFFYVCVFGIIVINVFFDFILFIWKLGWSFFFIFWDGNKFILLGGYMLILFILFIELEVSL